MRAGLTDALKKDPGDARLLEALADLDAAAIGTIHSFAQRILRSHALSAGLPLGFQPSAGGDASDVTRARVRAAVEDLEESLDDDTRYVLDSYGLAPYDLAGVLGRLDLESLRLGPAAFIPDTTTDVEALWAECAQRFEDFLLAARTECQDPNDKLMVFFEEGIPPLIALLRGADQYEVAAAYPAALRIAVMGNKGAQGAWGAGGGPMWRIASRIWCRSSLLLPDPARTGCAHRPCPGMAGP